MMSLTMPRHRFNLLLILEWVAIAVLLWLAISLTIQLNSGLNDARNQYVQTTCDTARNTTHDFSTCGEAQQTTHTEYLCDATQSRCWVEDK